jgi:hypothetical protein
MHTIPKTHKMLARSIGIYQLLIMLALYIIEISHISAMAQSARGSNNHKNF